MSDGATLALAIAVGLILVVVVTLMFGSNTQRRRPARSAAEAFHRLLIGQHTEARELLADLARRPDAPAEVFLHLGEMLREEGHADRALAMHRGLLARPHLDQDLRRLGELALADDLVSLGRVEEAEARLAELEPRLLDEDLLERHARVLHRLGRRDEAADLLLDRKKLSGPRAAADVARYLAESGRQSLREGDTQGGLNRARRARQLDAQLAAAYAVEGDALVADGRLEAALDVWGEGLERAGGRRNALLPRVVEGAFRSGRLESWLDRLEKLHIEHPQDKDLWKAVADLRLRRGDVESFFAEIEDPPYPGAADVAAWAGWLRHVSAQGDPEALTRLLSLMPDSFGPVAWTCPICDGHDPEPRVACAHCGHCVDLVPAAPGITNPALTTEGT